MRGGGGVSCSFAAICVYGVRALILIFICIASCRAVATIVDMFVAWSASTVACADGSWFRIKLAQVWDGYARLMHCIHPKPSFMLPYFVSRRSCLACCVLVIPVTVCVCCPAVSTFMVQADPALHAAMFGASVRCSTSICVLV